MKGIIIAGGTGSRLDPLTRVTNKNLLPIYNKPLIYFPIEMFKAAGITDIMIISGKGHAGQFLELLTSGDRLGVKISYGVQEIPGGIAQALSLCEDFADKDKVAVVLGDNIFENYSEIIDATVEYESQGVGSKVFLKKVSDPERFGVATISPDGKISKIIEKPTEPETNLAVVGLYMYDFQVWDIIKKLKPSNRGELEITDVNNFYINQGSMTYKEITGWWIDAGTFDSMLRASVLVARGQGIDV